jgi:phosphodiesterase/alkaline phosphatase D-like protein
MHGWLGSNAMSLDRREFLAGTGAAAGSLALASAARAEDMPAALSGEIKLGKAEH